VANSKKPKNQQAVTPVVTTPGAKTQKKPKGTQGAKKPGNAKK
jgi:hypothetical protein